MLAHPAQMEFFRLAIQHFPHHLSDRVIDSSSLDIDGGSHREINASECVGVDLAPGANVDLVSREEDFPLPYGPFDVAMSSECFEHNERWEEILKNLHRLAKPGGLGIFSCATVDRAEHGSKRSDRGFSAPFVTAGGAVVLPQ